MAAPRKNQTTLPQLSIRLLGRFGVLRYGKPIPDEAWGRRKAKTLLKVLLTNPGHVFAQDQLIEALFEGKNPKSAVENLYGRVSELRRALEPGLKHGSKSQFIVRQSQGYRFDVTGACWIDTQEFVQHLNTGERCQQEGRHAEAVEALEGAISLYRGEFLEADRYEEWALGPREHWQERYSVILTQLAEGYAHLGDLHRAAIACRAAFDLQPSREAVLRQLMSYHYATGERAEALRVYRISVDALKNELDVAPSAETEALHSQILQQVPPTKQVVYDKKRVAVLPMINISPDPEDEYFADGMTEELIYTLSQVRELRVIAQTSTLAYKNTKKTVAQIGCELSVGTVVEGSVRKVGDDVRVVVQLINVQDEEHLWAHEYDRTLVDAFAIQTDIAHKVAEALELELLDVDRLRMEEERSQHLEAYTLYLKGRHYFNKYEEMTEAIANYEQALHIDPDYALAYAGLAVAHCFRAIWTADEEAFSKAEEAARKALALASALPEAHTSLALVAWLKERDWEKAEDEFKEAIGLNPRDAEAHHWYGQLLEQMHRPHEAFVEVLKAYEVDPLSPRFNHTLGVMLNFSRRYDEAVIRFEKALEIDPNFVGARFRLARSKQVAWYWEGAEEVYRSFVEDDPDNPHVHQWLGGMLLSVGRREEALVEIELALELADEPAQMGLSYNVGWFYYLLGKQDLALQYMKAASQGYTQPYWTLGMILNELGNYDEALEALKKAKETLGGSFIFPSWWHSLWIDYNRGVAYARMGKEEEARQELARLQELPEQTDQSLCIALLYFVLEETDLGFEWLEKSFEQHDLVLYEIKNLPVLNPVRSDPRYLAILARMGLPP